MHKKESNKVNSFNASVGIMVKNEHVWTGLVNVKKLFGLIQTKLPLVSVYDQEQNNNTKPFTTVKKLFKTTLLPMDVQLSLSFVAYAAGKKIVLWRK
ncbi:MAG: hypothetical protein HC831_03990 [Chloroflexia bacterium]|nr:hypothetical protein [Chloroflexia bacterium]